MALRLLILWVASLSLTAFGAEWFVVPQDTSAPTGNGTIGNPGSLFVAIHHTNWAASIAAGDTVWLRGGTYTNGFESQFSTNVWYIGFATNVTVTSSAYWDMQFRGETNAYVTWRSYPNEWAKIDGLWRFQFWLNGTGGLLPDWHRFQDLEFYWTRKGVNGDYIGGHTDGGNSTNNNNQWINCIIHDTGTAWNGYTAGYVRGCVVWYSGQDGSSHLLYGHAKNLSGNIFGWVSGYWAQGAAELWSSNIFFGGGEAMGFPSGTKSSSPSPIAYNNNSVYNKDRLAGGITGNDIGMTNNYMVSEFNLGVNATSTGLVSLVSNIIVMQRSAETAIVWGDYNTNGTWTVDYNKYYTRTGGLFIGHGPGPGFSFNSWTNLFPQFDAHTTTASNTLPADEVRVYLNQDQERRANIAVYNWTRKDNVSVNLSGVLSAGSPYRLFNAQDYLAGAIQTGTYNGTNISVPMTNLSTAPVLYALTQAQQLQILSGPRTNWMTKPLTDSPEFGVFIVMDTGNYSSPSMRVSGAMSASGRFSIFR